MEPRLSRIIIIREFKLDKSDLYPNGEYYGLEFIRMNRKGEPLPKIIVSTENRDSVLNYVEEYLETGTLREVSL